MDALPRHEQVILYWNLLLVALVCMVSLLVGCAHWEALVLLYHDGRVVLSHPIAWTTFAWTSVVHAAYRKDRLDLLDCLLLLQVSLSQPLQDSLFIFLEASGFSILSADLNDLLLYGFVFLLADCGPLLGSHLVGSLPNPFLPSFYLSWFLFHVLHLSSVMLFLCLEQLYAFLFDCICMLLTV